MITTSVLEELIWEVGAKLNLVVTNVRNVVTNPLCDTVTISTKAGKEIMKISLNDLRYADKTEEIIADLVERAAKEKEKQA